MPDLTQITGGVVLPDGSVPFEGRIHFTPTGWDAPAAGRVQPPATRTFVLGVGGGLVDVYLSPSTTSMREQPYRMSVTHFNVATRAMETTDLGLISVPEVAEGKSVSIRSLLSDPGTIPSAPDALAQIVAKAAEVDADRSAAQTARTGAEAAEAAAEASAATASTAAANALAAEVNVEAAFANANVYSTISAGRAAVADGGQFIVATSGAAEFVRYRRDSSTTQTEMARYPTSTFAEVSRRHGVVPTSVWSIVSFAMTGADQFLHYATGAVTAETGWTYAYIPVVGGEVLKITHNFSGSLAALAVWYDASDNYIGYTLQGRSVATAVTDYEIVVPSNAAKMGVCKASSSQKPIVKRGAARKSLAQDVDRCLAATTSLGDALGTLTVVASASGIVDDYYIVYNTGLPAANTDYEYARWDVTPGETVYLSGRTEGGATALAVFMAGSEFVGYNRKNPGSTETYSDVVVTVPEGATSLLMTQRTTARAANPSTLKRYIVASGTGPSIAALPGVISDTADIKDTLSSLVGVAASVGPVTGSYVNYSNGAVTANASYQYTEYSVTAGETLYLSGRTDGTATALAVFMNGSTFVSYVSRVAVSGAPEYWTDEPVVVPAGATRLLMTQLSSVAADNPSTVRRYVLAANIAARVKSLEDYGTVNDWQGQSVVWFGNSIPTGTALGGSYPLLVAADLGFSLTRETTSGMAFRAGIKANVTGGDPFGWAGSSWTNIAWSLGLSAPEKQTLIDNWSTWRPLLTNSPPTDIAPYAAQMLDTSYTTRLVARHLGANRKDWYVFDNCFNDCNTATDLMTAGADGGEDRTTYLGVMNFLIRLILEDNPYAKIALVGHYENQRPTRGVIIAGAQQMVADRWSLPLLPLWDRLGWSQETIDVNGSWVSGSGDTYNWTAGTGAQTLTVLNRILPDGVHPAADASGKPVRRIADVVGKWMRGDLA